MILVDFSQVAIAAVYVFQSDFQKGQEQGKMKDILRHTVLSSLLVYKREYSKQYGEIVIACDGRESWRKSAYVHYKAHRAKKREESTVDWETVFEFLEQLKEELKTIFPWRVIDLENCEGDDIIGVMTKYVIDTRVVEGSLYPESEPVLIISSDGDMGQLHSLGNVRQWSPMQKKYVKTPGKDFLIEKIIRGDSGDGVPSVLCDDDWFVNPKFDGVRAKPVTVKVIDKFKNKQDSLTEDELAKFKRNEQMISFGKIPKDIQIRILREYKAITPSKDLNKIMEFLMKVRARQLLDRVTEFKV